MWKIERERDRENRKKENEREVESCERVLERQRIKKEFRVKGKKVNWGNKEKTF